MTGWWPDGGGGWLAGGRGWRDGGRMWRGRGRMWPDAPGPRPGVVAALRYILLGEKALKNTPEQKNILSET